MIYKHRKWPGRLRQPAILMFGDIQSIRLESLIRKLRIDDVLLQPPWRVEYVYLSAGFAHYRVLYDGDLVGIRDVTSAKLQPAICRGLAAYLAHGGMRPELAIILPLRADVDLDSCKHRVPPLFMLLGERRKGRRGVFENVYSLFGGG